MIGNVIAGTMILMPLLVYMALMMFLILTIAPPKLLKYYYGYELNVLCFCILQESTNICRSHAFTKCQSDSGNA